MPVLQLDDQQFPLKAGATTIGAGVAADVQVPGYSGIGVEAIVDMGGTPTVRRAEEAAHVRVNGVLLGAEPTPLMHGDKIEVAGLELRYADDAKGGATQFVSATEIAAMAGSKRAGAARATTASGGRLVSLVDGKEYSIADGGLILGRDAACDVVVAQNEVSRRHAEIAPDGTGYVLRDMSANGVFVNGQRVQVSQLLSRADVLRVGSEEFRFYADIAPASPTPAVASPIIPTPAAATPAPAPATEPVAPAAAPAPAAPPMMQEPPMSSAALMDDLELVPIEPPMPAPVKAAPVAEAPAKAAAPVTTPPAPEPAKPDTRPVIAFLEALNEGPGKGTKYEIRSQLAHIGRGGHNDVKLSDESVSETHAKLQKREDGWYAVDMDSTNGTYVGGSRVTGERKIDGSPDLRFGGLKFRFTTIGDAPDIEVKGTRTIAPVGRPSSMAASQATAKAPAAQPPAKAPVAPVPSQPAASRPEPEKSGGMPGWIWIVVGLVIAGAVAFFVLKGKA